MSPVLSREIKIGQLLDNRFEITALIDRSGMATIFKALDRHTHQMVVLKSPSRGVRRDSQKLFPIRAGSSDHR